MGEKSSWELRRCAGAVGLTRSWVYRFSSSCGAILDWIKVNVKIVVAAWRVWMDGGMDG